MSKYLEKAKELRGIETPHYNCAQSVLVPFAEDAGLSEEMAMKVSSNFGAGMRVASTCGAFTGGLIALGLFGVEDSAAIIRYTNRIKENHEGTIICSELLKINKEKGLEKKKHCDAMVYECLTAVEEILREEGKIS